MKTSMVKSTFCIITATVLTTFGTVGVIKRSRENENFKQNLALAAAAFVMPEAASNSDSRTNEPVNSTEAVTAAPTLTATSDEASKVSKTVDFHEDEEHLPVVTSQFGESGLSCDNFYIKDTVGAVGNFESLLNLPLGFEAEKGSEVQVLIYHTHTTESYLEYDKGYYHKSFYPRSEDSQKNMLAVGDEIVKALEKNGIGAVHATEVHDSPQYTGAYDRSWETAEKYMEQYPEIKVVLDIHRDSIAWDDGTKVKPTFEVNGKKAAQIMIMAGCDLDGSYGFPDWEYNLRFALKLQRCAENMYPGMTRPLYFGDFAYNMPLCRGSLLIEVGTDVNTIDEAKLTGELLGNVLAKVLQTEA